MGFLDQYLRSRAKAKPPTVEQEAVFLYFPNDDLEASIPLQEKLHASLKNSSLGMFDGNEVGQGELTLYLYGLDAELLFRHIEPILRGDPYSEGGRAVIRWGGPEAPQREVIL